MRIDPPTVAGGAQSFMRLAACAMHGVTGPTTIVKNAPLLDQRNK
jgi:hypothetical protein